MHILGLHGMTRRIYTYVAETGWGNLNLLATIGVGVMTVSMLTFLINVAWSRKKGIIAGANPWSAATLEWATPSPPPPYSFIHLPTVRGRDALWDDFGNAPVIVGLRSEVREVLTTSLMDAEPQHTYEIAGDSIWPVVLALTAGGSFIGAIFNPWAIPIGALLSAIALGLWFWRGNEPLSITERARKTPEATTPLGALPVKGAKV
jgi:heme/copper-type cytochrome/quinol oxidase subunit 1